jgi:hypothetical protein
MPVLVDDAPSSLAELVSPLATAEFLELIRKRELTYRPGAVSDRFASVAGWAALRRMIESGNHPKQHDAIRVTRESHAAEPPKWMTDGKVDVGKLEERLADGYSIVVVGMESHVSALAAICEEIKSRTQEGARVGAVVTSGVGAGAFITHYDPEDLIILQVEGTKRWQVFGPPVRDPLRRMPKQKLENAELLMDEVLEPGDLLLVPAGYWHHCESGLSTSVHLGIFFLPPTPWHALEELVRPLAGDEAFRTRLTRLGGAPGLKSAEAELKKRMIEKIEGLDLGDFVARWHKVAY